MMGNEDKTLQELILKEEKTRPEPVGCAWVLGWTLVGIIIGVIAVFA